MKSYENIKKDIRKHTPKENDCKCYICQSDIRRTENHHLLKVADIAKMCIENGFEDYRSLYFPRKNLCHEHHLKWHSLTDDNNMNIEIKPEEIDKYIDLYNEIIIINDIIPQELEEAYIDLFMDMADTIDRNLEIQSNRAILREMSIKQIFDNEVSCDVNLEREMHIERFEIEERDIAEYIQTV